MIQIVKRVTKTAHIKSFLFLQKFPVFSFKKSKIKPKVDCLCKSQGLDSDATWWYLFKTCLRKISKVQKQTTLRWDLEPAPSIYSEIELTPPSLSEIENCGLDKRPAEVVAAVAGYIPKK